MRNPPALCAARADPSWQGTPSADVPCGARTRMMRHGVLHTVRTAGVRGNGRRLRSGPPPRRVRQARPISPIVAPCAAASISAFMMESRPVSMIRESRSLTAVSSARSGTVRSDRSVSARRARTASRSSDARSQGGLSSGLAKVETPTMTSLPVGQRVRTFCGRRSDPLLHHPVTECRLHAAGRFDLLEEFPALRSRVRR